MHCSREFHGAGGILADDSVDGVLGVIGERKSLRRIPRVSISIRKPKQGYANLPFALVLVNLATL